MATRRRTPTGVLLLVVLVLLSGSLFQGSFAKDDPQQQVEDNVADQNHCPENMRQLLKWGVDHDHISDSALPHLLRKCNKMVENQPALFYLPTTQSDQGENLTLSEPGMWSRVVTSVRSKFTLLNVLYTGGGLLVIGAMTLFMTVGWEIFGGLGISGIATLYGALFAVLGRYFYEGPQGGEWEVVCTMLLTMTLFMTPLAVYGMQRSLGFWRRGYYRSQWSDTNRIPMTLGVMIVSAFILLFTRFSFFIAPIAFGAWLVSIDFSSPNKENNSSLFLGITETAIAIVLDKVLGLNGVDGGTDFTFWLYTVGVAAFWLGLSLREPSNEANGVLYLCINVFLVVAGQYLDRIFLMIFGAVGIIVYSWFTLYGLKISSTRLIIIRFIASLLLLASSLKYGSQIAFWASLMGIITWNTSNAMRINDPELYYWAQFLVNLSINQGCWSVFGERVLSFYIFEVRCATMLYLVTLYGMLCFHPTISAASSKFKIYRVLLSYVLMVMNLVYPVLGIVGSLGISGYIFVSEFNRPYYYNSARPEEVLYYLMGVSLVVTSYIADSRIIYLQGLLISLHYIFGRELYNRQFIGWKNCAFSVLVIFLSVLYESQPLLLLGGAGVFLYLSYLAKRVFRNSILFPFALTVLGLSIIFIGVQYQKYQGVLRTALLAILPQTSSSLLAEATAAGTKIGLALQSYVDFVPNGLAHLAGQDHYTIPIGIGICFGIVLISQLYTSLFKTLKNTTPVLEVKEAYLYWPKDTNDHGIVIWLRGNKPKDFVLSQVELHLVGSDLWNVLESRFGSALVSTFKFTFYPLKLCPAYLNPKSLKAGEETFDLEVHLGTGKLGGQKISHKTLTDSLYQITSYNDPWFEMQFQHVKRFGTIRGVLFSINYIRCSDIANAKGKTNGHTLKIKRD